MLYFLLMNRPEWTIPYTGDADGEIVGSHSYDRSNEDTAKSGSFHVSLGVSHAGLGGSIEMVSAYIISHLDNSLHLMTTHSQISQIDLLNSGLARL